MLIGFVAGVIPASFYVNSGTAGWTEPLIVYLICVGDPGTRKSAVFGVFQKAARKIFASKIDYRSAGDRSPCKFAD